MNRLNNIQLDKYPNNNNIGDEGVIKIVEMLRANTSLTVVYLYENNIRDEIEILIEEAVAMTGCIVEF